MLRASSEADDEAEPDRPTDVMRPLDREPAQDRLTVEILPLDDEPGGDRPTVELRPLEVDPSATLRRWPPALPPPRTPVLARGSDPLARQRGTRRTREALRVADITPDGGGGGRARKPTR